MLSTPAPIPISIIPAWIWFATSTQACRPEEHCLLTARTAVSSVKPATKAAARNSVAPAPGASTLPTATSSTYPERMTRAEYDVQKRQLQVELLKLQNWVKDTGEKVASGGVLEATLAALGEGGTAGGSDDDLVWRCG